MSIDSLLSGASVRTVKFSDDDKRPIIGASVVGTIVAAERRQATTINGEPKTFSDGNPMTQLVLTLQTDDRDATDPDDDGERRLFATWNCEKAIREAVTKASADAGRPITFELGGRLAVQLTGTEPAKTRGHSPAHVFAAKYVPPTADVGNMLDQPTPAPTNQPVRSVDDLA